MNEEIKEEFCDSFCPMPVSKLLDGEHHFIIPSFQRGYRWDEKQVKDLLEDLLAFVGDKKSRTYFLQPIVLVRRENHELPDGTVVKVAWEVLDGQQRLTTMLLVLKNLLPLVSEMERNTVAKNLYDISYVVRPNLDFDNPNPDANIDGYYLYQANQIIRDWINEKFKVAGATLKKIPDALFYPDGDKIVQFIWYVTQQDQTRAVESIEIFNRLNKGKIGLTGAELIKALFVLNCNSVEDRSKAEIEQQKFAIEWDIMERQFQDDGFWYFINGSTDVQTRIDALFDFVAKKKHGEDQDYSYRWFQKQFDASRNTFADLWKETKIVFDRMVSWFEDIQLYNYIGYLISCGSTPLDVYTDIEAAKRKCEGDWDRQKVCGQLRKMIAKTIRNVNIDAVTYSDDAISVRKLLLLLNIETSLLSGCRFPFDAFKKQQWDIEHVDSQTTNNLQDISDKIRWVEYVIQILRADRNQDAVQLLQSGMALKTTLEADQKETNNNFTLYYSAVVEYYSRGTGEPGGIDDKDSIGNLVLLDSVTNRSYQNAPFPYKRYCIIEKDKKGAFVPICTKKVFQKYYSDAVADSSALDLLRWHSADKQNYLREIHEKLDPFFGDAK